MSRHVAQYNGFARGVTRTLNGHWLALEPFQARLHHWNDDDAFR